MQFLHKLRRRKRDKNPEASAAASLLLPALPFHDDDKRADSGEDKGTQTSNDSGYGSTENASPTLATPAELAASEGEEHSSQDLKFAQLVNLEQDVVNRRRRESIRFELFGHDDDDDDEEEEEAREGERMQSAAGPPPRPRLSICTSVVAGRRPPTAVTPVSADSPQPQAYRPLPAWHSYSSTPRSTTKCSYFQPRYHTWASQRLLDITHDRIAASRRRSEAFPPGSAADAGHSLLAPPSSTHTPATLRELRTHAPKDPLRVRLARSVMLVKLRNGLTSDEAGELYFGPASPPLGLAGSNKPPSYSVAASGSAPLSGNCPSPTSAPHPLALVLPRLPAWAHRPTYQERCVVTRPDQDDSHDETLRPEEERPQAARPGCATVSSRVAAFVAELAEHERLQSHFATTIANETRASSRPPRAPPPSRVRAQRATSDDSPVSSLPTRVHHDNVVFQGAGGATAAPPGVVEDLLASSRTVLIPARPSRPARVRTYDDSSRASSVGNSNNNDDDDDDERPLAMLRRSASSSCISDRRQLDGDLLGAQHVPLPFWLPPLISATASRTHSSTAWRPLSYAGSSATSGPRRGVVVAVPRDEVAPVRPFDESDPNGTGSLPPVAPSVVVCTPAKARQLTSKPSPGSLYWPTTTTTAPKSLSFLPPPERSRQMPIATKTPDLRSRHSSIELHGSFKVIEDDFQFPSQSKRWTRTLSLRKARSFWHVGADNRPACSA